MRQTYVVMYDISDDRRLRRVYRICLGYGDRLQYSVFRCQLSPRELVELRGRLGEVIHHREDQVVFVDVGPADGRATSSFQAIGKPYRFEDQRAVII
ncbi:MAG: CRISPR-associated endonuclease Cas2 [Planctomycetota bacterium]